MITSILIGLVTGAGLNLGVMAAASALGVPAATAAAGLRVFRWGKLANRARKRLHPTPALMKTMELIKPAESTSWMQ